MKQITLILILLGGVFCAKAQDAKPDTVKPKPVPIDYNKKLDAVTIKFGFMGISLPPHGKPTGPFFTYSMEKPFLKGYTYAGMFMSGKTEVFRLLSDSTEIKQKFYTTGLTAGVKIPSQTSRYFADSHIGIAGEILWDNWRLSPEFPVAIGPSMGFQFSYPEVIGKKKEPFRIAAGFTINYWVYYYKTTYSIDVDSRTNPGVEVRFYVALKLLKGEGKETDGKLPTPNE